MHYVLARLGFMNRTALLVIDVQDSFKANSERWSQRSNLEFETHTNALIKSFREAGQPVIFVLHSDKDDAFQTSSEHYKLMDFLDRQDDDLVLHKSTRSCFASTDLQRHLNQLGVHHLVITGIQTEQCCETTTRDAGDLGYKVDFVTEATLTFPIKHWAGGETLDTAQIIERTEYALAGRFARIANVAMIQKELI